jgi:predicted phosphodiesterase
VRVAVLSDMHSNLEALQAAVQEADRIGVEAVYGLGDLVGYNADPAARKDA